MRVLFAAIFLPTLFISVAVVPTAVSAQSTATAHFETKRILLGGKTITVEIADNDQRRVQGLMFRKSLAPDQGMLFIFDSERVLGFWMKNTLIPLSIGYFDSSKRLINVHEMTPEVAGRAEHQLKTYRSSRPALYALEMEKNWFSKNKIKPGSQFTFVQ